MKEGKEGEEGEKEEKEEGKPLMDSSHGLIVRDLVA